MVSNTKFSFLDTKPRAKRAADAKISTEVAVPLQQQRRPRFKIGSLGLTASAVNQGYLGGPETRIRAKKGSGLAEISAI